MTYESIYNYKIDLSLLVKDWSCNYKNYKKLYKSYDHWTREKYGFCIEHAPNGSFFEIHNNQKFTLFLMRSK